MINEDIILTLDNITLKRLSEDHTPQLIQIATANPKIWEFAPRPYHEDFQELWIKKAFKHMQSGTRICFVIFHDNQIVGSSSYYEIDHENKRLNIGYTWFDPLCWGTKINPISKFILFQHAFEVMKFNRVGFSVDSENLRSCNALRKLGIKEEGVLRNHLILANGRIRHSVIFSIIIEEWPEFKKQLEKIIKT